MKLTFEGKLGVQQGNTIVPCAIVFSALWPLPSMPSTLKPILYVLHRNGYISTLTSESTGTGRILDTVLHTEDALEIVVYKTPDKKIDPLLPPQPEFKGFKRDPKATGRERISKCVVMARGVRWLQKFPATGGDADFSPLRGFPIDLSGEDLSGVKFGKADFRTAVLANTILARADISKSMFESKALKGLNLSGATLAGGLFPGFDFSDTDLSGADLSGADLSGAKFLNSAASKRGMQNAKLNAARFQNAVLTNVALNHVSAEKALFIGATLTECDASDAKLAQALFIGSTLQKVKFNNSQAEKIDFTSATLRNCTMDDAKWPQAYFQGSSLTELSFARTALEGALFCETKDKQAATLKVVDFHLAKLGSADFGKTRLDGGAVLAKQPLFGTTVATGTRFIGATVPVSFIGKNWAYLDISSGEIVFDITFDGSKLIANDVKIGHATKLEEKKFCEANFSRAILSGCSFKKSDLQDAIFESATLDGTNFSGADVSNVKFDNANLTGANFNKANLRETVFTNVLLAQVSFTSAFLLAADFRAVRDQGMAGVNFNNACLVNAKFDSVMMQTFGHFKTSFDDACLLGASFRGASLKEANLSGAKLAKTGGTIKLAAPGTTYFSDETYTATILPIEATGNRTYCPRNGVGPCGEASLYVDDIPSRWPSPEASS